MKHPILTKASDKEIRNWHPGSGYMFLSAGSGGMQMCFIRFVQNKSGTFLMMGNSKAIRLTSEQEVTLGDFAIPDSEG